MFWSATNWFMNHFIDPITFPMYGKEETSFGEETITLLRGFSFYFY